MARTDDLTNFLTDVSAAIKEKLEDDTPILPAEFDTKIASIKTASSTSDATATAGDIIGPKTAYVDGVKITGSIQPTYKGTDVIVQIETVVKPTQYDNIFCCTPNHDYFVFFNKTEGKLYLTDKSFNVLSQKNFSDYNISNASTFDQLICSEGMINNCYNILLGTFDSSSVYNIYVFKINANDETFSTDYSIITSETGVVTNCSNMAFSLNSPDIVAIMFRKSNKDICRLIKINSDCSTILMWENSSNSGGSYSSGFNKIEFCNNDSLITFYSITRGSTCIISLNADYSIKNVDYENKWLKLYSTNNMIHYNVEWVNRNPVSYDYPSGENEITQPRLEHLSFVKAQLDATRRILLYT